MGSLATTILPAHLHKFPELSSGPMAGKRASRCGLNDTMARWGSRRVDGVLLVNVNVIFQRASWGCVFGWSSWSDGRGVGPCSRASGSVRLGPWRCGRAVASLNAAVSNGIGVVLWLRTIELAPGCDCWSSSKVALFGSSLRCCEGTWQQVANNSAFD